MSQPSVDGLVVLMEYARILLGMKGGADVGELAPVGSFTHSILRASGMGPRPLISMTNG